MAFADWVYKRPTATEQPPVSAVTAPAKPEQKFMSGNLLMDLVDALSAAQYAAAGMLQGKGAIEGIKQRANWGEWLGQQDPSLTRPLFRIGQFAPSVADVVGTAMDVVIDPLWLLPPAKIAKVLGEGAKAVGLAEPVAKFIATSPKVAAVDRLAAKHLLTGIKPETRQVLKELDKIRGQEAVEFANVFNPALEVARKISRLPGDVQNIITRYMEAGTPALRQRILQGVPKGVDALLVQKLGDAGIEADTKVGEALVAAGRITPETFEKWRGKHLRRVYQRFEDTAAFAKSLEKTDPMRAARIRSELYNFGAMPGKAKRLVKSPRIPLGATTARKELALEERQALGEITEAGYRLARGAQVGAQAASRANMLRRVAETFGSARYRPGYLQMPEGKQWGALRRMWVPEAVHHQLIEFDRVPGGLEKLFRKVTGWWKIGKVPMNPTAHFRNLLSNLLLADNAGLSPARVDIYAEALHDLITNGEWLQQAKQAGAVFHDTFMERELPGFLSALQKPSKGTVFDKAARALRDAGMSLGAAYNLEEQWFKLAVYIFKRKQGASAEAAAKAAEDWLFNYRKVPVWVERARSGAYGPLSVPFITFSYKAIPAYVKALYTNPARVARWGKYAAGVERTVDAPPEQLEAEGKVQPDWMKKGFWLRLPVTDRYGRALYLDVNYILPFADIFNMSGLWGPGTAPGFVAPPLIELIADLQRNHNRFTGHPIWPEGATPTQKRDKVTRFIWDFLTPPLAPGAYNWRKLEESIMKIPDEKGRIVQLDNAIATVFFGIKPRPIAVDEEAVNRINTLQYQIKRIRGNIREVARDTKLSQEYKDQLWKEALDLIGRKIQEIGEYANMR